MSLTSFGHRASSMTSRHGRTPMYSALYLDQGSVIKRSFSSTNTDLRTSMVPLEPPKRPTQSTKTSSSSTPSSSFVPDVLPLSTQQKTRSTLSYHTSSTNNNPQLASTAMPFAPTRTSSPSLGSVPLSHPPNSKIIDDHLHLSLLRRTYNAFSTPALPPSPPPDNVEIPELPDFGTGSRTEERVISQELLTRPSGKGRFVRIVEVAPRDGLQNLPPPAVPTEVKRELVERLLVAGARNIEVGSFVRGDWVPQMADTSQLLPTLPPYTGKTIPPPSPPSRSVSPFSGQANKPESNGAPSAKTPFDVEAVHYPVLVPNMRGLDNLIKLEEAWKGKGKGRLTDEIAVFVAASEAFSEANNHSSIDKVLSGLPAVIERAQSHGYRVRGYVSCVITCPYSGPTDPEAAVDVAERLLNMGCYEVSMGDTTGEGDPESWRAVWELMKRRGLDMNRVAAHCHDTFSSALSSIVSLLPLGLKSIDSSLAGLGGCPYSPGATGNVATEDVVYTLHKMGYETGINLDKLVEAGNWLSETLGVKNESRVGRAIWARRGSRESKEAKVSREGEADTEDGM